MSKPPSGLFHGTKGDRAYNGDAESVIAARVKGLDLREHPTTQKQLGNKQRKEIRKKIRNRTATRTEWKQIEWDRRIRKRRKDGIDDFRAKEAIRLSLMEKRAQEIGHLNRLRKYLLARNPSLTEGQWNRTTHTASGSTHI